MRPRVLLSLALCLAFSGAGPAPAADRPRLELSDEKLALQEIRPLDRRVYVLTLEGTWKRPPTFGVAHYVNVLFPDGGVYSHRALDEEMVRAGEVRVLLPEYQLIRHGVARGGTFRVVVSAERPVSSADAPQVVSDALTENWPLDRPIVRLPPRTRHTPPPPIDAFPLPGDRMLVPPPRPGKVPPPPPNVIPPPKETKQPEGR